jgi:hypothetical protein
MKTRLDVLYVVVVWVVGTTLLTSGLIWLENAIPTFWYILLIALGVIGGALVYALLRETRSRETAPQRDTDAT